MKGTMMKRLILFLSIMFLQTNLAFATHNPRLEITPDSWDFGKATELQVLTYNFQVKNTGDDTLEIKHITTSCGCISASMLYKKLFPGESTFLTVKLNLQEIKTEGKIKRDVYIESNDPEQRFKTISVYAQLDTGKKLEETIITPARR